MRIPFWYMTPHYRVTGFRRFGTRVEVSKMTLDVKTPEDEVTALPKYVGFRLCIEAESYHRRNDSNTLTFCELE